MSLLRKKIKNQEKDDDIKITNKVLERTNFELSFKEKKLQALQKELEIKDQELRSLDNDFKTRNKIIDEVTQQLMKKQMQLAEKNTITDYLKNKLKRLSNNH